MRQPQLRFWFWLSALEAAFIERLPGLLCHGTRPVLKVSGGYGALGALISMSA